MTYAMVSPTSRLIEIISKHDKLLDFMDEYGLVGLIEATEGQLQEYVKKHYPREATI